MKQKLLSNIALFLFSLSLSISAFEIFLRWQYEFMGLVNDVRKIYFQHDSELGWIPKPNAQGVFTRANSVGVSHNSRGFRDSPRGSKTKPRLLVIGDSFVWGFDVEQEERFTELLQERIPEWEVINLGVSGYGTDQEFLLLKREFDNYQPDLVLLVFTGRNDFKDNSTNVAHNFYYKPYFLKEGDSISLKGVPIELSQTPYRKQGVFSLPAKTATYNFFRYIYMLNQTLKLEDPTELIILEIDKFLKERNTKWFVGLVDNNQVISELTKSNNIPRLNLKNEHQFETYGRHWTAEGHSLVAERIYKFMEQKNLLGISWRENL